MFALSENEKRILIAVARSSLLRHFGLSPKEIPVDHADSTVLQQAHPCFVTLMKEGQLRGCIGSLVANNPLIENAATYAIRAATEDPRFPCVEKEELETLNIEMSVISPQTLLPSLEALQIGRHGLVVEGLGKVGVLLAKVAEQFGWSAEQFLKQTCLKAGLNPERHQEYQVFYFEEISFVE